MGDRLAAPLPQRSISAVSPECGATYNDVAAEEYVNDYSTYHRSYEAAETAIGGIEMRHQVGTKRYDRP